MLLLVETHHNCPAIGQYGPISFLFCQDNRTSCRDDINTLGHKLTIETIEPIDVQTNDDENNNGQTPVLPAQPRLGQQNRK